MSSQRRDWSAMATLAEPTRRRVYDAVRSARAAVTRDDVASVVGIGRPLAAFHLEALARSGLLAIDYARPPGRTGPGAGRPAKRYRAVEREIALTVPERRYDLAAEILLDGICSAGRTSARHAAVEAAARKGREIAAAATLGAGAASAQSDLDTDPCDVLAELGYEPARVDDGVRLRNCPFHGLLATDAEFVCGLNHAFLQALADGLRLDDVDVKLQPTAGECCVRFMTAGAHPGDRLSKGRPNDR